jgi:hypothetical protein
LLLRVITWTLSSDVGQGSKGRPLQPSRTSSHSLAPGPSSSQLLNLEPSPLDTCHHRWVWRSGGRGLRWPCSGEGVHTADSWMCNVGTRYLRAPSGFRAGPRMDRLLSGRACMRHHGRRSMQLLLLRLIISNPGNGMLEESITARLGCSSPQ